MSAPRGRPTAAARPRSCEAALVRPLVALVALVLALVLPTGASGQGAACTQGALLDLREGLAGGADVAACVEAGQLDVRGFGASGPLVAAAEIGNLALMWRCSGRAQSRTMPGHWPRRWVRMRAARGAVLALLRYGMDPNIRVLQGTALHRAIWSDRVDFVLLLLRYGADPDARNDDARRRWNWRKD